MLIHHRSQQRPYEMGPHPFELLPHAPSSRTVYLPSEHGPVSTGPVAPKRAEGLAGICKAYNELFRGFDGKPMATEQAAIPDDLRRRSADIKGFGYFLDADFVGICPVSRGAAAAATIVISVAWPRAVESDNAASDWVNDARAAIAHMRLAQIGSILAGYIRRLGFPATLWPATDDLASDATACALAAGLLVHYGDELHCPILGSDSSFVVVETTYPLALDRPLILPPDIFFHIKHWFGWHGARSLREQRRRRRRRTDLSQYPMETVPRVDRPTTLILDDQVPRVPKRASFFSRAMVGDLGEKAKFERTRFAFKHPTADAMMPAIGGLVPFQDGAVNPSQVAMTDPATNSMAIKSLSYALGADLTGICEIPDYAWYSHGVDGQPIPPYHRYAVVMLIDQGYDTMEGASGDDWISGSQSMRGYLRGAEIAGVMAAHLREQGYSARAHTNNDSDLLQIPLVLWAGLGELSRIGELVLNPFVGPRFKSVVMTTDLPLMIDKPIDFGLQTFCRQCLKCARECPCDAISWGEPVMFNGYEMYKPDVERCTRYRLTNARGAACGRCMKTCPINKVVDADGGLLTLAGSWLGVNAPWLKPLMVPFAAWFDDFVGNGRRNLSKKWWLDLELVDGRFVAAKSSNIREIDPYRERKREQPIAYYPASVNPPPDAQHPVPVDRKAALLEQDAVESAAAARARIDASAVIVRG